MKIKLGVIFGGDSVEHEVSIITAVQAMNKINIDKYEVIPIYISKNKIWYTGELLKDMETYQDMTILNKYAKKIVLYEKNNEFLLQTKGFFKKVVNTIDVAFPIVHGTNVEDGVLQGYLQTIGIPYVGSDVYASVMGQDKIFMKQAFQAEGLPVVKYHWFYDSEYNDNNDTILNDIERKLKYPVIVKPATLGSSIGITKAENKDDLIKAIDDAVTYDSKIIVEEMVRDLIEINISVLGNYEYARLSEIEEVMASKDFLSFEDKYVGGGKKRGKFKISKGMVSTDRIIPARLNEKIKEEVKNIAIKVNRTLGTSGVSRIDFLVDKKQEKVFVNEVNSIPGCLSFYLWEPIGKSYSELLEEMINIAIKDYKKRSKKIRTFDNNILSGFNFGSKGTKGKLK